MGMRQAFGHAATALAVALALAACNREHRPLQPKPAAETAPRGLTLTQLYAGQPAPMPSEAPRRRVVHIARSVPPAAAANA